MKRTVDQYEFAGVMTRTSHFSYEGAVALYEYLTDLEDEINEEFEFDPVSLRGEFAEYDSLEEAASDLGCASLGDLSEYIVAEFDGGIIVHTT